MASSPSGFKNSEHFGWSDMSNLSYDANSITEISRNNLSDTNKPGTLHNDTLCFTSKDNAPQLTSVRQIRNLFSFDAVIDFGCFTHWLRASTCEQAG